MNNVNDLDVQDMRLHQANGDKKTIRKLKKPSRKKRPKETQRKEKREMEEAQAD